MYHDLDSGGVGWSQVGLEVSWLTSSNPVDNVCVVLPPIHIGLDDNSWESSSDESNLVPDEANLLEIGMPYRLISPS